MKKQIVALTAVAALTAGAAGQASASSSHTVQKGDTLWAISQANNVTVQDLKDWNSLSSTIIYPSQELKVSKKEEVKETYTVVSGDTLFNIAKTHGITLEQLVSWNGLSSDLIFPGDEFVVSGGTAQEAVAAPEAAAPAQETAAPAEEAAPAQEAAPAEEAAAPAEETAAAPAESAPAEQAPAEAVQELTVTATAYTAYCNGCSGTTATGIDLRANPNQKVIAVDPNVIPLGSKVWVEGYGEAIAGDTGGAIKGNKIDLFIPSQDQALNYGVQEVQVKILN
ncbi:3D domain-containing protein [Jeotgalibacillus proteolyticus]|uniref:Peptidoglycan-binding protein n=1 Tax=Jeotgalibacillus proteolyticus TaxID=2082395 RepID=A0A2S5GBC5_9BACL|nr:3D domain-containing protein [Jeotgalibacillus proteolyticus]PPA70300.1 peptidoglycan-binding protein [Jeotgalibacillus proteolyticus]